MQILWCISLLQKAAKALLAVNVDSLIQKSKKIYKKASNLRLLSEIFINDRFCIKESTFSHFCSKRNLSLYQEEEEEGFKSYCLMPYSSIWH